MFVLAVVIIVLVGTVALVWTSRHLLINREQRGSVVLTEDYADNVSELPSLSVVVAAKDEAANIEACVRTMLQQDYPNFEMIVCDDRSVDGTGEIVQRIAAEDDRLRLIRIEHLPNGWCGKCNAMQTGIAAARGKWICMIDADCRQTSRRTLSAAMKYALHEKADLLSVLPVLEMKGFLENVIQPVCSGVMIIWFNPDAVNDPRKPQAYANGAFMLMSRKAYEAVGTHEIVKDRVNEDMHIAAKTKSSGLRLRVIRNTGLYTVRMYTSLREILNGWSRIFFGTFGTLRRLSISLGVLLVMGMLPYAAAILGFVLTAAGVQPAGLWLACGLLGSAAAAMQISVIYRFYSLIGARKELAWSYLIGCLFGVIALIQALGKLRKGAKLVWRNTSYSTGS